jgi:glycosyltransferase involved in cell wall biosynthesis
MEFSIVIPLYNKASYVEATLTSVFAQKKLPKELIIVDDCSTDGSLEKAKETLAKAPKRFINTVTVQIIELEENRGPGHARNLGYEYATGDIMSFLDADDLYHEDLLSEAHTLFTKHRIEFLVVGILLFPSKTQLPKLSDFHNEITSLTRDAYHLNTPLKTITSPRFNMGTGSNVFTLRKWMESIKYVEDSRFNEANDFWYRVLKNVLAHSGEVGLLAGDYLKVREVMGSLSRKTYQSWSEIEIPPIYKRYQKSTYKYDRLLMGMICRRWIRHSLRNLNSLKDKILFVYKHRTIFFHQFRYVLLRIKSG